MKSSTRPRRVRLNTELLEDRVTPSTFKVVNTNDSGGGTLRTAIIKANAQAGTDNIVFAIPTSSPGFTDVNGNGAVDITDFWTISLASALPAITQTVVLDGWSQGGAGYTGRPLITLRGQTAGAGVDGLQLVNHSGSIVRGLAIQLFDGNGVEINGGGGHRIYGNRIGTNALGTQDRGNHGAGVFVVESGQNVIGGTAAGRQNVISGNDLQGIHIEGAAATANQILGNLIGTRITGDIAIVNGSAQYLGDGIRIEGGGQNVIGGTTAAARNVISGNFDDGIDIREGSVGNTVKGNFIGVRATGRGALGNGADGIFVDGSSQNVIGGVASGEANVISSNGFNGVFLYGDSQENVIGGNFIGTNSQRDQLGNGTAANFADGIFLGQFGAAAAPSNNTISRNTIAFNADSAIAIGEDATIAATGNTLSRNSVYSNAGQDGGAEIDLGSDGATGNDAGDADTGPNNLQNVLAFTSHTINPNGTRSVTGTFESTPDHSFRFEVFASTVPGEGRAFLGFGVFNTGPGGGATWFFNYTPFAGQPRLTITITDTITGDTSEFTPPAPPAA